MLDTQHAEGAKQKRTQALKAQACLTSSWDLIMICIPAHARAQGWGNPNYSDAVARSALALAVPREAAPRQLRAAAAAAAAVAGAVIAGCGAAVGPAEHGLQGDTGYYRACIGLHATLRSFADTMDSPQLLHAVVSGTVFIHCRTGTNSVWAEQHTDQHTRQA